MDFVADLLLVAGALGAGFYCYVLARRLSRFNDLEKGVGGAIAALSSQVDDLNQTMSDAQAATDDSKTALSDLTQRAEAASQRLELMMASLHDVPPQPAPKDVRARQAHRDDPGPVFMHHDRAQALR